MPSNKPLTTILSACARFSLGARSPTSGSMSCGVTVLIAVMNDSATKTLKDFVRQSPSQSVAVKKTRMSTNARRRNTSPNGQRKSRPAA